MAIRADARTTFTARGWQGHPALRQGQALLHGPGWPSTAHCNGTIGYRFGALRHGHDG